MVCFLKKKLTRFQFFIISNIKFSVLFSLFLLILSMYFNLINYLFTLYGINCNELLFMVVMFQFSVQHPDFLQCDDQQNCVVPFFGSPHRTPLLLIIPLKYNDVLLLIHSDDPSQLLFLDLETVFFFFWNMACIASKTTNSFTFSLYLPL